MSVSIQILDSVYGRPAAGVLVSIARNAPEGWADQAQEQTDVSGLVSGLSDALAEGGIYKVEFDLDRYFSSLGVNPFYSAVTIKFKVVDAHQPQHISLFISPYSCATYHAYWNLEVQ